MTFDLQRESVGTEKIPFKQTLSAAGFLRLCSYLALTHHQISGMNTPTRFCLCATDLQQQVLQEPRPARTHHQTLQRHLLWSCSGATGRLHVRFSLSFIPASLIICVHEAAEGRRGTPTPLQSATHHSKKNICDTSLTLLAPADQRLPERRHTGGTLMLRSLHEDTRPQAPPITVE